MSFLPKKGAPIVVWLQSQREKYGSTPTELVIFMASMSDFQGLIGSVRLSIYRIKLICGRGVAKGTQASDRHREQQLCKRSLDHRQKPHHTQPPKRCIASCNAKRRRTFKNNEKPSLFLHRERIIYFVSFV